MYVTPDKNREFFFPLAIVEEAAKQGIKVDELKIMVRHSTRITHPLGNRRYKEWLFMVEGDRVIAFGKITDMLPKAGPRSSAVVHPDGRRQCPECDAGLVRSAVVCPECGGEGCSFCDAGWLITFNECERCEGTGSIVV
jgi:hypothetical protein